MWQRNAQNKSVGCLSWSLHKHARVCSRNRYLHFLHAGLCLELQVQQRFLFQSVASLLLVSLQHASQLVLTTHTHTQMALSVALGMCAWVGVAPLWTYLMPSCGSLGNSTLFGNACSSNILHASNLFKTLRTALSLQAAPLPRAPLLRVSHARAAL